MQLLQAVTPTLLHRQVGAELGCTMESFFGSVPPSQTPPARGGGQKGQVAPDQPWWWLTLPRCMIPALWGMVFGQGCIFSCPQPNAVMRAGDLDPCQEQQLGAWPSTDTPVLLQPPDLCRVRDKHGILCFSTTLGEPNQG